MPPGKGEAPSGCTALRCSGPRAAVAEAELPAFLPRSISTKDKIVRESPRWLRSFAYN